MEDKILIVAEIGQAHEGSFEKAKEYVEKVSKTGVDIIKFQTHIAQAESSIHEPFRVKMNTEDKTRFDYWKRMEFTKDQWKELKKCCDENNVEFMSSPFSNAAVDLLEEVGVKRYKVGSGEVNNFLILEKIAKTGKGMILSSGMSSFEEIDKSVGFIKELGNDVTITQCSSKYPTKEEDIGLNVMKELKEKYGTKVGLSDHSGTIYPSMAAAALGADMIEVHVALDKTSKVNPDASSSLDIKELAEMVRGVRFIEKTVKSSVDKNDISQYKELKSIFEKSLAVNKDLDKGHEISFEDLEAKKPKGYRIEAQKYKEVIGKKIKVSKKKNDFLNLDDLEI